MTTVTRTYHWSMGHRLQRHQGLCKYPHGHNYVAEVTVAGEVDSQTGMVYDFSLLDASVKPVIDLWDHAFMVEQDDPFGSVLASFEPRNVFVLQNAPTAENIAAELAREVQERVALGLLVWCVKVWETHRSYAEWRRL